MIQMTDSRDNMGTMNCRSRSRQGFTIVEVMMSSLILVLVTGGLYASGTHALKMSQMNLLTTQARALGVQKLEEIAGLGIENILVQMPYTVQVNTIQDAYQVTRSVEIVGHEADGSLVTNVLDSVYLELHVHVQYQYPRSTQLITNTYSTIVK